MSMEFYSEAMVKARKRHVCEMCGKDIQPGELYYRENGKWEGDFFSRALHVQCHLMEMDYCAEVECEFTWDSIEYYIDDAYCCDCVHSTRNEDMDGWTDCPYRVTDCPKILEALRKKYGETEDVT